MRPKTDHQLDFYILDPDILKKSIAPEINSKRQRLLNLRQERVGVVLSHTPPTGNRETKHVIETVSLVDTGQFTPLAWPIMSPK